jgi:hypothetical protein
MLNLGSVYFVPMTLIHNHFSISKPSTIYCVLGVSCYGPVLFGTGPVTAYTNPVANPIYISGTDYYGQVPESILPVLVYIST